LLGETAVDATALDPLAADGIVREAVRHLGAAGFRAKPGERIAFAYMGDLFDPARGDDAICLHFKELNNAVALHECTFLIQTRHVERMLGWELGITLCGKRVEIGTSFTGPQDIENVRALGQLPDDVVRFIAFEPIFLGPDHRWDWSKAQEKEMEKAVHAAKPNWAYIGVRTPGVASEDQRERISFLAYCLREDYGTKMIFKPSCGPDLASRNEEVELP
jgi:hypothetical protein